MEHIMATPGAQEILLAQAAPAEEGGGGMSMFLLLGAMLFGVILD